MGWRVPLVDLDAEYAEVARPLEAAVLRVLRGGRYILGPETQAFEQEFAGLVGVPHAIGVGSGTEALWLALRAAGVGEGDQVVTSAFTYFATVEAIVACGARPVFADVEAGGFNIDPDSVEAALTPRSRAVLPVHLFGRCADMARLRALADRRGLVLIEDAAQAVGAARGGRGAGAWGLAGAFSFYPSKNLAAAGDGGCITTADAELAERLRRLRSHGLDPEGRHTLVGTTSRLDALQAAVLRAKLPFLAAWTEARRRNAALYARELEGCPGLRLPQQGADETVVWNQYTLRCSRPAPVRAALEAAGVEWRHYYPRLVFQEPGLAGQGPDPEAFPEARRACAEAISIPVRPSLAPETIREIAGLVRGALEA